MKKFLIFLCVLICVSCSALADSRVIDEAGLLSSGEEAALEKIIAEIGSTYQTDVVILTKNSIGGREPKMYAADYFIEHGYGFGPELDGLLFLISMSERDYATVTSGSAIAAFSDSQLDSIHADITPYLSRGDYNIAFNRYLLRVENRLRTIASSGGYGSAGNGSPSAYVYHTASAFDRVNAALPVILLAALAIALIVAFTLKAQMKTVRRKNTANSYVQDGSFQLSRVQDIYLYTTTVRRKIESDQPRGGGHSGGGSSTFHSSSGHTFGGRSGKF